MRIKLMRKRGLWQCAKFMLLAVAIIGGGAGTAYATTSNSSNYQATQLELGASAPLSGCSEQFCAQASIGNMTTGKATNGTTTAHFGSVTKGEPLLEVIVDEGESNLGVLTTERTATKITTVQVRSYLSDGYVLQIVGDPPKYKDHTLTTPSSPTASDPGTEQFGINATANTTPEVGADPVQVPSSEMSFGAVEDAYKGANLFKYASGDVVARSETESGRTDYTISMIVNISNSTPAGHFSGDFSAVVIPSF